MISPHDLIAREAVAQLMGDVKAGKRETVDVDDVIAVLEAAPGAPGAHCLRLRGAATADAAAAGGGGGMKHAYPVFTHEPEMTAFKMSADRWRTWDGERFECWSTEWNANAVARYRAAGLKVRRFEGETYVRPIDFEAGDRIDRDWALTG